MNISFVVIAYNEERNIEQTLRSIIALDNLPAHYEIIVVNDGSRDHTAAIVEKLATQFPQIRLITQSNAGRGAARATGVRAATGRYIAFIDADILLPLHWLTTCQSYMDSYDAVGGVAVPDGDVAFVHRIFHLPPKPVPPTTTITGNNGFFKRQIFDHVAYNPTKKDGEDVDLVFQIHKAGFTTQTIGNLHVEHHESKNYAQSLAWLFVSGRGASRQLYEQKQLRLPDIAFFGFLLLCTASIVAIALWHMPPLIASSTVLLYVAASSAMHLLGKFKLMTVPLHSIGAVIINISLLLAYYLGRLVGLITQARYA